MIRDKQDSLYLLDGRRTPMAEYSGSSNGGAFADVSAVELGTVAAEGALEASDVAPDRIDHVIVGNVIQSSPDTIYAARHIGLRAGVPEEVPALTVNRLCGSGMQSIISGCHEILHGPASCVLAGGTENMSQAPHVLPGARTGFTLGGSPEIEDWLQEGLRDAHCDLYMAQTSDNLAEAYEISREAQDRYALRSHRRGAKAVHNGRFDEEIAPVAVSDRPEETIVSSDDHVKPDTTLEQLQSLPPSFGPDSSVTAGNASGIVDGGAAVVIASGTFCRTHRITPRVRLCEWATVGVDPTRMGIGPAKAIPAVLDRSDRSIEDVDLFEINEAFAGQYLAVEQALDLDRERVNVNGGAIALGHPLGMTGTRLVLTLVHTLHRRGLRTGIASACIGGGQGIALLVEVDGDE